MKLIDYRDVARRMAQAETEGERARAAQLTAWYDAIGTESTRERMKILHEELVRALSAQA